MLSLSCLAGAAFLLAVCEARGAVQTCHDLKTLAIQASAVGLPTHGAQVRSARHAKGLGGGYCRVLGSIASLDPKANPIRFEVNLPETWNGKALQFGGGGFDGYLRQSDGRGWTVVGDKNQPSPLDRGFTTFGSDSGHHHHYLLLPDVANIANAKFGRNDEERHNFASDGLKKTHDVAVFLMQKRYGIPPRRMYFVGGSNGGREALKVVDRWPMDYDGVMAAYASWNQIETDLQFMRVTQAMYTKGQDGQSGWLPSSKTKLLRSAVLRSCDRQDGLRDEIVSNPSGCLFDPASLRCSDGRDHKGCLSDGQERTILAFSAPQSTTFSVESGMHGNPGYNVLRGGDLVGNMGWFRHPFRPAIPYFNSAYYVFGDGIVRSFLPHGPKVSLFDINTTDGSALGHDPQEFMPRVREQSLEDDASLADLSPFQKHGGKLLLIHGVADSTIPTESSVLLYTRIVAAMGQDSANEFLRLYLIPGFGHGQGVFNAGFDTVGVLDRWADAGVAPVDLIVVDQNKHAHRSRPMCVWPSWPQLRGNNADEATSYICTRTP